MSMEEELAAARAVSDLQRTELVRLRAKLIIVETAAAECTRDLQAQLEQAQAQVSRLSYELGQQPARICAARLEGEYTAGMKGEERVAEDQKRARDLELERSEQAARLKRVTAERDAFADELAKVRKELAEVKVKRPVQFTIPSPDDADAVGLLVHRDETTGDVKLEVSASKVAEVKTLRARLADAEKQLESALVNLRRTQDQRESYASELAKVRKELVLATRVSISVPSVGDLAREEAARLQAGEVTYHAPDDEGEEELPVELQSLRAKVKEAEARYLNLDKHCKEVEAQRKELEQRYIELADTWNGVAAGVVDPRRQQGRLDLNLTQKAREEGRLARKIARALLRLGDDAE